MLLQLFNHKSHYFGQGLTITIKSPYVFTYIYQNFGVRDDIRGQIPKTTPSVIPFTL